MIDDPNVPELLKPLRRAIAAQDDDLAESLVRRWTADAAPPLTEMLAWLDAPDADRRWWGVRALTAVAHVTGGGETLLAPLRQRLHDDDPSVRCASALALAELGLLEATPDLVETLGDDSGWVRASAADALALLGEGAVPALAAVLADSQQGARSRAAYALSKIRTLATANVFYHYLQDENPLVQAYANDTLEQMGLLQTILVV